MLLNGGKIISETALQMVPVMSETDYISELDSFLLQDVEVPSPSNMYSSGQNSLLDSAPDQCFYNTQFTNLDECYNSGNTCYNTSNGSPFGSNNNTNDESNNGNFLKLVIKKEIMDDSCSGHHQSHLCSPSSAYNSPSPLSCLSLESETEPEFVLENMEEKVESMVMEHLMSGIEIACRNMRISQNPFLWTIDDVRQWLEWTLSQYDMHLQVPMQYFLMDGRVLCSLSEEEFRQRSPYAGELLYAQLDLWKTAVRQSMTIRSTVPQQQQRHQQQVVPQMQQQQVVPVSSVLPSFKIEDSLLDMSSLIPIVVGTPSPAPSSVVDELLEFNGHLSDYGSDVGYRSDEDTMSDENSDSDRGRVGVNSNCLTILSNGRCSSSGGNVSSSPASVGSSGSGGCPTSSHSHIHLWQFLKELLVQPHLYGSCIRWMDRSKGVFKIEDSVRVARLWGKRKNRPAMNYDKLSRSIRQYYKKGIMKKTERSQRLVYQFCHPYFL